MNWEQRIAIDPNVMGGKLVIKGTRVPLQVLVKALALRSTIAEVCDGY